MVSLALSWAIATNLTVSTVFAGGGRLESVQVFLLSYPLPKVSSLSGPGTCTNKKTDDARKRNGKMANSFREMAMDWKVMDLLARPCDPIPSLAIHSLDGCAGPSLCHLIW